MGRLITIAGVLTVLLTAFALLARFVPPDTFWPPAVIALMLPGLLLVTLLFFLLQVYRRKWKSAVLAGIVCAFAFPLAGTLFAWPSDPPEETAVPLTTIPADTTNAPAPAPEVQPTLTIATSNMHTYRDQGWNTVADGPVQRKLQAADADILLLQEARHAKFRRNFFELTKQTTGLSDRHQPYGKTVATYARSITRVDEVFDGNQGYNGFLVTDVATELGTIRVVNAHLQSNQISQIAEDIGQDSTVEGRLGRFRSMLSGYGQAARIRALQANKIREVVENSPHPVIVGGDFNDVPSSYTYRRILSPRLQDAWALRGLGLGTTFTGPLPGLRIDYVLVDTSLTVVQVERLEGTFSDHRPVRVVVR